MNKMLFGKAIEYKVASEMLREGFEIYLPAVDDHGVDLMARTPGGNIVEVQVKSLSKSAKGGLFSPIKHTPTSNFYFLFYLESQDSMWIFNSADFLKYATVNKSGIKPILTEKMPQNHSQALEVYSVAN